MANASPHPPSKQIKIKFQLHPHTNRKTPPTIHPAIMKFEDKHQRRIEKGINRVIANASSAWYINSNAFPHTHNPQLQTEKEREREPKDL